MQYNYAATCLFGLEGMVGGELDALGIQRTKTIDGRVYFTSDGEIVQGEIYEVRITSADEYDLYGECV